MPDEPEPAASSSIHHPDFHHFRQWLDEEFGATIRKYLLWILYSTIVGTFTVAVWMTTTTISVSNIGKLHAQDKEASERRVGEVKAALELQGNEVKELVKVQRLEQREEFRDIRQRIDLEGKATATRIMDWTQWRFSVDASASIYERRFAWLEEQERKQRVKK